MIRAMHVADRLLASAEATNSLACVGLDPRPRLIPPQVVASTACDDPREHICAAFLAFNRGIIDAIAGHCACIKPQVACYEAYGAAGLACLEQTIAHARAADIPVIVDAKRGDIGSTATHYREAWLGSAGGFADHQLPGAGGDWLTVNGYLGGDSIAPCLGDEPGDGGLFVLVKTSNPGSSDLQNQACGDRAVMDVMADLVRTWGTDRLGSSGYNDVGAVVGATWPHEAQQLRQRMPQTLFLVPGYGAQGGSAADALAGSRPDGTGCIVNSSRGIIGAWQQHDGDWQQAIASALNAMNQDLNAARQ